MSRELTPESTPTEQSDPVHDKASAEPVVPAPRGGDGQSAAESPGARDTAPETGDATPEPGPVAPADSPASEPDDAPAGQATDTAPTVAPADPSQPDPAESGQAKRKTGPAKPPATTADPPWFTVSGLSLFAGVVAVIVLGGVIWSIVDQEPEEVVAAFFDAIHDGDVDEALSHVSGYGFGVPVGEQATFLHPDAIDDDWEVLEIGEMRGDFDKVVPVTIGDSENRETGLIGVVEHDGVWYLKDPFVEVEFVTPELTYLHVNDRVVELAELYAHDVEAIGLDTYLLFPGRYDFLGDLPVAGDPAPHLLMPEPEPESPQVTVSLGPVTPGPEAEASLNASLAVLVERCATVEYGYVPGCPMALVTDALPDDVYVDAYRDVRWEVARMPTVTFGESAKDSGFAVEVTDPGEITVTAAGVGFSTEYDVTAACGIDPSVLRAQLNADGSVLLHQSAVPAPGIAAFFPTYGSCHDIDATAR
ncbi:hypothetical protein LX16_3270 [Stackebrandtia albiflava]|uniref:Uncharacterized protein n=1 Tax=Stackebrandtia albiflava TaxID=406432 RepID=A0A562V3P5_9ACTN|nr:hypothetical protein [Stackebrandtia albiflava]TWJ12511.1 hypothetical protein LX16_3270 [Stackebrandtia albiflava]